jgi:hypothetical protein
MSEPFEHRRHILHLEHGDWVAYKSKSLKKLGLGLEATREDGRTPTDIDRIPLGTPDPQEAITRLNRRLRRKRIVRPRLNPDQLSLI